GIPTEATMPLIIAKANMEAKSLVMEIGFFVPEMVNEFLAKANAEAGALAMAVSEKDPEAIPSEILGQVKTAVATPAEPAEAAKPDEPEEEEEAEEETAGIGSLFG
ncbi:MAG: 50S ribosomal protein L10, partial [Candidatus Thorarchaeota archaeon]